MAERVKDPVCGMVIEKDTAEAQYKYWGGTYYFCSPSCKTKFENDPVKYIDKS